MSSVVLSKVVSFHCTHSFASVLFLSHYLDVWLLGSGQVPGNVFLWLLADMTDDHCQDYL